MYAYRDLEDGAIAPTNHPMWETQVALERGMRDEGEELVASRQARAVDRQQLGSLPEATSIIRKWLPAIVAGMREWMDDASRQRGVRPIAYQFFSGGASGNFSGGKHQKVGLDVYCLIAIRELLDRLGSARPRATSITLAIGRAVEHETMVRAWEAENPALFTAIKRRMDRDGATPGHRALVYVNRFNALRKEGKLGAEWREWNNDERLHVGWALVANIMRVTGAWTVEDDTDPTLRVRGTKYTTPKLIVPSEKLVEYFNGALLASQSVLPVFMPTVVPPRDWQGMNDGGYWTPYVPTPDLVRFRTSQPSQRAGARLDYDAINMPAAYSALNALQSVPWRVNEAVLSVVERAVAADVGVAGLPSFTPPEALRFDGDKDADPKAFSAWKRYAAHLKNQERQRLGHVRAFERTLSVARRFAAYNRFYFPHMLCFRGRAYAIPVGLQPQGDDTAKGLLRFAEEKPVGPRGAHWLAIHLANSFGHDKVPFRDRVEWAASQAARWQAIGADPYGRRSEWMDCKSPWQALAAAIEWAGFLREGDGFRSSLPVAIDGTCNGLQHLSALTLDADAGRHVNLCPSSSPEDVYARVGYLVLEALRRVYKASRGERRKAARWWLDKFADGVPREATKRQVMVLPYGGTKTPFFDHTMEWLNKAHPLPHTTDPIEQHERYSERIKMVAFLRDIMWDAAHSALPGAMSVMAWLREAASVAAKSDQPIFWRTPSGFVVRHFYGKQAERRVRLKHDGTELRLTLQEHTARLDTVAQLRGIPPNFVHSLDAAAMMLCVNACRKRGVTAFRAVHDSFGTHACDMDILAEETRRTFVEVHESNPLMAFRAACVRVTADRLAAEKPTWDEGTCLDTAEALIKPPPNIGTLDLRGILQSEYFFA